MLWMRAAALVSAVAVLGCGPTPEEARIRATSRGTYDPATGKLVRLTYDKNQNGRIDTWVRMDGARQVSAEIDTNEDGKIDRWEEYGDRGQLVKASWSRTGAPSPTEPARSLAPDAFAYAGPDGRIVRIEYLDTDNLDRQVITRREFVENDQIRRAEEDTDGDAIMDRWEHFENGQQRSVEFDDGHDGKPDRRLTYDAARKLVLIESDPDPTGAYRKRVVPGIGK